MVEERFLRFDAAAGAPADPVPDRVVDPSESHNEEPCRLLPHRARPGS